MHVDKGVKKNIHKSVVRKVLGKVGASDQDIHEIVSTTLQSVGLQRACVSRSTFATLVGGYDHCLEKMVLSNSITDAEPVVFHRCKIKETLQAAIDANSDFATTLLEAIDKRPRWVFPIVCYHDECTAGNVVQVATSQKVSFFYFALPDIGYIHHEEMWHPLAMIQRISIKDVQGGFSAVWRAMVQSLLAERLQDGVPLTFSLLADDGQLHETNRLLLCSIGTWIGDLDAIKVTWDCTGSSGLRPCYRCKNVLKRGSGLPEHDSYFIEVDCADPKKFDIQSNASIFEIYDDLLSQAHRTKAAAAHARTIFGFTPNSHGALACREVREACPPDRFLFDPMHCYYSNGCASWEVNLLLQKMEESGISRTLLEASIEQTSWQNRTGLPHTATFRKRLICEAYVSGDCYKGGAKELDYLLPLLGFCIFKSAIKHVESLQKALVSFKLLLFIRRQMSDLKHQVAHSADILDDLQQKHQAAFKECYGYDFMKPKHHVRMHLPEQYKHSKLWVDSLSMEKRHRVSCFFEVCGQLFFCFDAACTGQVFLI